MTDDANTEIWTLDGKKLTLRHITPGDALIEQKFVRKLSANSRYMRFHGTIKELNKKDLATFTNPNPLNAEALIILYKGEKVEEEVGVARFVIDPDGNGCEFAVVIADEWQKRGVGMKLMKTLISHAQARGIKQIYGYVLKNNSGILRLVKKLGFEKITNPDDSSVLLVSKSLRD